ncbi:hypothetical protein OS965_02535 [Streptomyces sp. H27-G5]|uniref:hypothetical protein n=1 Tax=Streptomyces sp. H27-G5 TaxID=2996698 RepID=UPI00226F9F65|nr:hypothetical protein [Streptomyces sp. H27-G5]MCY0917054.1 hypothetical protein [Streptomyces sp. H27-G5]
MALIRKAAAGSDSHGHVWPEDGSVVEIDDPEQIAGLLAIDDAGFSEVTPQLTSDGPNTDNSEGDGPKDTENAPGDEDTDPRAREISEIDPQPDDLDAVKPAAKKAAVRKTTASKPE